MNELLGKQFTVYLDGEEITVGLLNRIDFLSDFSDIDEPVVEIHLHKIDNPRIVKKPYEQ